MLHPGLANLLKAIVVARSAAHAIEILRNDWMVCVGQLKQMQFLVSVVAGGRSDCQADLGPATSKLRQAGHISHDDIRPRDKCIRSSRIRLLRGGSIDDWTAPLTTVVTSIGYMLAVIEISPT